MKIWRKLYLRSSRFKQPCHYAFSWQKAPPGFWLGQLPTKSCYNKNMKSISEKELINGLLKGNKKHLRIFYDRYSLKLKNYIAQKISQPDKVEEILQDSLLEGLEALRDFTGSSSLYTYLCAIAKYKTIDYYRKKKLKKILFSNIPGVEHLFSIITTPEEELDKRITKKKVHEVLAELRPKYSQVLKLKYLKGFSVKQVAKKMNTSFKSAESLLFRARRDFAVAYEKRPVVSKTNQKT